MVELLFDNEKWLKIQVWEHFLKKSQLCGNETWFTSISEVRPGVFKSWPPGTISSGRFCPKMPQIGQN